MHIQDEKLDYLNVTQLTKQNNVDTHLNFFNEIKVGV